ALQPAPNLDAQVCGLCRKLVDQEEPAMRQHRGGSDIHALKTVSSVRASATDVSSTCRVPLHGKSGKRRARSPSASIPPQLLGIAPAIEIKRVIEMPLAADGFVIVVALCGGKALEAFRDCLEAARFRREIAPRRVDAAHDQRQAADGLV